MDFILFKKNRVGFVQVHCNVTGVFTKLGLLNARKSYYFRLVKVVFVWAPPVRILSSSIIFTINYKPTIQTYHKYPSDEPPALCLHHHWWSSTSCIPHWGTMSLSSKNLYSLSTHFIGTLNTKPGKSQLSLRPTLQKMVPPWFLTLVLIHSETRCREFEI